VTIRADSYQPVIIKPDPGAFNVFRFASAKSRHIILDRLALDATNVQYDAVKITYGSATGQSSHIRLDYCLVMNAPLNGIYVDSAGNEFSDSEIRDNGRDHLTHGIYVAASDNLIEGCLIAHNTGYGVHIYNLSTGPINNNIVRYNVVRGNGQAQVTAGIILSSGSGNKAYENIVVDNRAGIQVDFASGAEVYNNIIKGNHGSNGHCIVVGPYASGTLIGGNTCSDNSYGITDLGEGTQNAAFDTLKKEDSTG
jgi:parallel beta-helix repeat protein